MLSTAVIAPASFAILLISQISLTAMVGLAGDSRKTILVFSRIFALTCVQVGGVHEADLDSKFGQKRGDEPIGPAVDDVCGEQMISALKLREKERSLCGHA